VFLADLLDVAFAFGCWPVFFLLTALRCFVILVMVGHIFLAM
jgi:hypothetical protein